MINRKRIKITHPMHNTIIKYSIFKIIPVVHKVRTYNNKCCIINNFFQPHDNIMHRFIINMPNNQRNQRKILYNRLQKRKLYLNRMLFPKSSVITLKCRALPEFFLCIFINFNSTKRCFILIKMGQSTSIKQKAMAWC